jgi:hypothetical protein
MIESCNKVRKSIPFWYWLVYDAIMLPFLTWAVIDLSYWFLFPAVPLAVAIFFDINEAIVKYGSNTRRRG